jgi:hypothetical protein
LTRYANESKEAPSEIEQKLAEQYPHFQVFYYLNEAHRGMQKDKWEEWLDEAYQLLEADAPGLVMYGPLLDSRKKQIKEALK